MVFKRGADTSCGYNIAGAARANPLARGGMTADPMDTDQNSLELLKRRVAACCLCAAHLPLEPRPLARLRASARLLIIGQAPGSRAHHSRLTWNDDSGDRLRLWMGVDRALFYDDRQIAIMPMGFCYPGRAPGGGDNPPRPECAPQWHAALRAHLPEVRLTLLVGGYAQRYYLDGLTGRARTLAERVRDCRPALAAGFLPLPHPSWRTTAWRRRNPWFEAEVLPLLREQVRRLVTGP